MSIFVLLKRLTCENNLNPNPEKPLILKPISERPEKKPVSLNQNRPVLVL
jgi:hypothetical protein